MFVGPLIPDRDIPLMQPRDIRVAAKEPQQFGDDRPKVDLLGGDKWKPVGEIKSELAAEDTNGAGPGAIGPWRAGVTNITKQVEILLHRVQCSGSWRVDSQ